jgi:hypothetical protein
MSRKSVSIGITLFVLLAMLPAAYAETSDALTLTVSQPVAVPGAVLQPGSYSVRFADNQEHTVLIRQANGAVVGLFPVIDAYRAEATSNAEVDVLHSNGGSRISSWFMPGNRSGWAFIYSGKASSMLAQTDKAIVAGK